MNQPGMNGSGKVAGRDEAAEAVILVGKAMADCVRAKLLSTVAEVAFEAGSGDDELGRGITVAALSERVGEPPRRVRYHLDAMCEQGLVEVTTVRRRRGALERCFAPAQLPMLDEAAVAALSATMQKKIFVACLRLIFADVTAALETGAAVRRPDWAVSRVPADVDEQGRRELAELHADFPVRAREIMTRALERMKQTEETPVRVVSANLFFEADPPPLAQSAARSRDRFPGVAR